MAHKHIEYDAIVIGGGPVGLATSLELAKKGKKVLVLERFVFQNDKGSSAGVSRQFRIPYPDEYMVKMAKESLAYWKKLEDEGNVKLLDKVGTLWFGDPTITSSEGNIEAAKKAMDAQNVAYTNLSQSDLEKEYHFKNLPENYVGLFQADGASIDFALTVKTLLDLNKKQENVTLKDQSQVTHIDRKNDMFWISVGTEKYVGKKLVITPGPFINDILNLLGFQVPVTYWQMAFPYMIGDFSANTEYKTIGYGFDCIGYELAKSYLKYDGSNIWLKNKLLTFDKMEEGADYKYKLTFYNLESKTNWGVYANSIILAMPRRSLELLDQFNFFFDTNERKSRGFHQELNKNIRSVIMEPAYKILMGFDKPWWKSLGIDSGHSITDLPMRQCYYFGTDSHNQHSMFLGSYGDMGTETFWKSLSDDEVLFRPKLMNKMAITSEEYDFLTSVQASQMMVDEVMNEVRELHGPDVEIPDPYVTWFRDWTDDPFGAGYHAWKAGYKVNEVMPFMRRPNPNEDIHICGEAYSDLQGWIEGAFCEAEKMLEEHFELKRPNWLDKDYYLGW